MVHLDLSHNNLEEDENPFSKRFPVPEGTQREVCLFPAVYKKGEDRGYKNVTLKTIMNTIADKTVNKITHHVPSRSMIYTKKHVG